MSAVTRFVVLATPRTGSNWLCAMLGAHPGVLCHHELFNPKGIHLALHLRDTNFTFRSAAERDTDPLALLSEAWSRPMGRQAVGFKLNWSQDPRVFSAVFADRGLRFLLTHRRNRVKSFVSEQLALRTGRWESYLHRSEQGELPTLEVESAAVEDHAARNAAWQGWLRAQLFAVQAPFLEIAYEDLDKPDTLGQVFEFLEVPPLSAAPDRATFKRTPSDLRSVVANHAALAERLAGTPLYDELISLDP